MIIILLTVFYRRLRHLVKQREQFCKIHHDRLWNPRSTESFPSFSATEFLLYPDGVLSFPNIADGTALSNLVFISPTDTFYVWKDHHIICVPETLEHRILRSKKAFPGLEVIINSFLYFLNWSQN